MDDRAARTPAHDRFLACAIIAISTVAAFWPVTRADYVEWDDPQNVFRNPAFNPPSLDKLSWYWRNAEAGLYIPLTYSVWALVAWLDFDPQRVSGAGLDPQVFHTVNLAIHVCSALLVFVMLNLLLHAPPAACIGALLFALHPAQVETVAWISGMKDLLAGMFSLAAIWLHLSGAVKQRPMLGLLALPLLAAALLAKPIAVVAPLIAIALDWGMLGRPLRVAIASTLPWWLLVIPAIIITRIAHPVPEVHALSPLWARPMVVGDALGFHILHVLAPIHFAVDYGRRLDVVAAQPLNWLAWLVPLSAAAGLWIVRKSAWPLVVGAIVFVAALLPVLGIVPFGAQIHSTVTDHYLYLPMLGVALGAAWLASRYPTRIALAVAVPLLVILAVRSWFQARHWRDTMTLFQHNLTINPNSAVAHTNVGFAALVAGDPQLAEQHTRAALKLRPNDAGLYKNLGITLGQQNRFEEAADALREAIRLDPSDEDAKQWLARIPAR